MGFWGVGRQVQWAKLTFFVSIHHGCQPGKISRCLLFDLFVGECDLAYKTKSCLFLFVEAVSCEASYKHYVCIFISWCKRHLAKRRYRTPFLKKHIPAMSPVTVASEVPTCAESVFIKMWQHDEYYFHECLPAALLLLAAACCCLPAACLLLACSFLLLAAACCCFFLPAACCCLPAAVPWWFFFPDVTSHYLMWLFCIAAVPWGWCAFSRLMWLKYGARMCLT